MENSIVIKITKIISALFMVLAGLFVVLIWAKGDIEFDLNPNLQNSILSPFFVTGYVALILCAILVIVFPIAYIIMNPKNAVRLLIVLGGLVVLAIISYFIASDATFTQEELLKLDTTPAVTKRVGAALIFTYIIGILAILSAIYSGVSKFFK